MPLSRTPSVSSFRGLHKNYFVFGPDSYLVDEARVRLTREICERAKEEFVPVKFDLDDCPVDELLNTRQDFADVFAPTDH